VRGEFLIVPQRRLNERLNGTVHCGDQPGPIAYPAQVSVTASVGRHFARYRRAIPTDILHFPARVVVSPGTLSIVLEELSGVWERPMIMSMPTTPRPQQRYDHRLRNLVQRTGDVSIATSLGVPRSTARLGKTPNVVVSLDVTDLRASELHQEVLELRRRVKKLTALLRLALALLRSSGFTLTHERLPDGRAKTRILNAVDRARACVPLRALLRCLRLSPSRFHAWRRLQHACALDDQSSCPRTSRSASRSRSQRPTRSKGVRIATSASPVKDARTLSRRSRKRKSKTSPGTTCATRLRRG
jgi:hypothetical protein